MNQLDDILDDGTLDDNEQIFRLASVNDRILNFIMDFGIVTFLTLIVSSIVDQWKNSFH